MFKLQNEHFHLIFTLKTDLGMVKMYHHTKNKNVFQSKAHLPLADRKSNTFNLTLEWPWPWDDLDLVYNLDLRQAKLS